MGRGFADRIGVLVWFVAILCGTAVAAVEPGPATGTWSAEGTWAFQPREQLEGGVLDLRGLNEEVAGQNGFVRRSDDGAGFVLGDGTPVRFWGVAGHLGEKVSDRELARHARFLARLGVNMVRVGGASPGLIPQEEGAAITDVNEQFVDTVWRTVAAMKKEGIYTRIAPFWDHGSVKYVNPDWGIEGYASGDRLNGLLFFEQTLQQGYRAWMRKLLTQPNPYTGIPLRDDPAVALIQIVSEDSLFFWWLNSIHGGPRRLLEEKFGDFAADKYGSVKAALQAWDAARMDADAPAEGRLGIYPLHFLTQLPTPGNPRRARDLTEFLARLERTFYDETRVYLGEELGARQLVTASNFNSANAVHLHDAQRWAWTAGDVIELNKFFTGALQGPQSFWRIQAGHFFEPRSAVRDPQIPPAKKQVANYPFILSSTTWIPPNRYTAEGPLINAVYGAMNGIDGVLWFSANAPAYDTNPYMSWWTVQGSHPMPRWTISHPGFMTQFPAAALIYRQGLVEPVQAVVRDVRPLEALFERRPPLLTDELDYAPAEHVQHALQAKRALMQVADPYALLAGRVEAVYGGKPEQSRVTDILEHIDRETGRIGTIHGQIHLDTQKGLLRIDAPRAQGMVGFLAEAGRRFKLSDVAITSGNDYASVMVVALDGRSLAESAEVLVQVGTVARPTDWQVRPASRKVKGRQVEGYEIVSTGRMPWRVRNTDAAVTVANPALTRATRLDEMGFALQDVPVEGSGGTVRVELPPNTLYLVLSAQ